MCGSGYPTYPNFLPPTLNFFYPNSEVGRELQNKLNLPTSEFGEKIHIKMAIRNGNLNFYAFSLWFWKEED